MFSFKVKVFWRTMDRQGQHYEPFVNEDVLYFDRPIFESEIKKEVQRVYGVFVDKVEICPTLAAPDAAPAASQSDEL